MITVFKGTQPLFPSDSLISVHSPTSSSIVTLVPSCNTKRSFPLLSGELFPLITGIDIIALWLSYTSDLFLFEKASELRDNIIKKKASQNPITLYLCLGEYIYNDSRRRKRIKDVRLILAQLFVERNNETKLYHLMKNNSGISWNRSTIRVFATWIL